MYSFPDNNTYIVHNVKDFNLDHIFDCGQCFRWEKQEDNSYSGIAFGKVANMQFEETEEGSCCGRLIIKNCTAEDFDNVWKDYLDLDRDYGAIKETLTGEDEIMKLAVSRGQGIRILKQDLWETIVSFIISQNNNIPRIKGCIEKLAREFGKAVEGPGGNWYELPDAEMLAALTVEDLAPVRLGYRAKYLIATAQTVCQCGLPKTFEELSALTGVGPKVANCISLFGMGNMNSFPIDVWVKRVMNQLYGMDESDTKAMTAYAQEHFGELGGIAQQYLFYYIRNI